MVYPQLFGNEEEQQNALRLARQEQAVMAGLRQVDPSFTHLPQAPNPLMIAAGFSSTGFGSTPNSGAAAGLGQLGSQGFGSQLGSQFGSQLGGGGQLGSQLGQQFGGQFGGQFSANQLSQLGGGAASQFGPGGPSLLDVQRAENLLAAAQSMQMNPNGAMASQFASHMMNSSPSAANQHLLQSRLGGMSFLGPNAQLPSSFAHEASLFHAKNHPAFSLATAGGTLGGGGQQNSGLFGNGNGNCQMDEFQGLLKRRQQGHDDHDAELGVPPSPSKRFGYRGNEIDVTGMKLAPDFMPLDDSVGIPHHAQNAMAAAHQVRNQLSKMREHREARASSGVPTAPKTRKKAKTFPVKLMQALIENPDEDAVAWLPDGKSFVIVQPDLFVESVLKRVFKECKYSSFVRKLHRWGFVRLTSGTGTDCFHHPLFQKNRMDMCSRIVCTPRDSGGKAADKQRAALAAQQQAMSDKPPSLAGVEKFFRTKTLPTSTPTTGDTTAASPAATVMASAVAATAPPAATPATQDGDADLATEETKQEESQEESQEEAPPEEEEKQGDDQRNETAEV